MREKSSKRGKAMTRGTHTDHSTIRTEAVKLTHPGQVRDHNEDFAQIEIPGDRARELKGALYLVADGMGGYQAGEVASQRAAETVIAEYYADAQNLDITASLKQAMQKANSLVHDLAQANPQLSGMGTTMVAAVVRGAEVHVANVGDSRAYLLRGGQITQITVDHSFVQEQIDAGILTPEAARTHPQRNVITRALGHNPEVEVDAFKGELAPGDTLLLCSDGLSGPLRDEEMAATLGRYPPQQAVVRLVEAANARGGPDNISALVLRASTPDPARPPAVQLQPGVQPLTAPPSQVPAAPARAPVAAGVPKRLVILGLLGLLLALVAVASLFALTGGDEDQTPTVTPATLPTTPPPTAPVTTSPSPTPRGTEEASATPTETTFPASATPQPTNTPKPTPTTCWPIMPALLSPPAGAQLSSGEVTFEWTGGSLCAGDLWLVRIDEQPPDFCQATTATQVTCSLPLGQHQWRVEVWRGGNLLPGAATPSLPFNVAAPVEEPTQPSSEPRPTQQQPTQAPPTQAPEPTKEG
jgi:serine/threonine protein phosphatase PrpC